MHVAIATAERTILGVLRAEGVHPRAALAAMGFGPDRYRYRSYAGDGHHGAVQLVSGEGHLMSRPAWPVSDDVWIYKAPNGQLVPRRARVYRTGWTG